MSSVPQPARDPRDADRRADAVHVQLTVTEPDLVAEIAAHPEGRARDEFIRSALRIGILALKQAQGRMDADMVRAEGDRLVTTLGEALRRHADAVNADVGRSLKDYFDPESGRFNERVKRLVEKDGELERLLRAQVGDKDSELARSLAAHFGEQSPIMKVLSPDASQGILARMGAALEDALKGQREHILGEFSLDRKESALARLVEELSARHGELGKALAERVDLVVKEFSLDNDAGALSRLVGRVERAQQQITSEFSLDTDTSALARMRRELLDVAKTQGETAQKFQEEVKGALAAMSARKAEARRSTTHGNTFEATVGDALQAECARTGDVLASVGATTGLVRQSKVGDFVLELGRDSRAAGARIVVEAKESGGYDLAKALAELETARKNRGCEVGLFVFSRATAPAGLPALQRHGNDVVVAWDAESESSDAFLHAGLSLARALCTKAAVERDRQAGDVVAMEKAVLEIERTANSLEEIETSARTIQNGSEKILNRVRIARESFGKQVHVLQDSLRDLKASEPSSS